MNIDFSVITFFRPDLQSFMNFPSLGETFMNFPSLGEILPPLGWLMLAFIIWLIGFAFNIKKQLKNKSSHLPIQSIDRNEVSGDGVIAKTISDSPVYNKSFNTEKTTIAGENSVAMQDVNILNSFNKLNTPPEFYVPDKEELKHKINIDTQKFSNKFKSSIYASGQERQRRYYEALEVIDTIWKDLLPHANRILKDTPIPNLINEIRNQMTRYWMNISTLSSLYDDKYKLIRAEQQFDRLSQERINNLEIEIDKIISNIESMINQLIDLSNEVER